MGKGAWLGFVFFVALIILGFGTVLVGKLGILARRNYVNVHFPNGSGLRSGDEVRVDGLRYGEVAALNVDNEHGGVMATLRLQSLPTLYDNHEVVVGALALLGGTYVSISRGTPGEGHRVFSWPEPPAWIDGSVSPGPFNIDLAPLDRLSQSFQGMDFTRVSNAIENLSDQITQGQGTIGQLMQSREMYDNVQAAISDLRRTLNDLRSGQGTIPALVNDPAMRDRFTSALSNGDAALASLRQVLERLNNGEGTAGRLLTDSQFYDELRATVDTVKTSFEEVRDAALHGNGPVGALMSDEQMATDLRETIRSFRQVGDNLEQVTTDLRESNVVGNAQGALQGMNETFGRISRTVLVVNAGYTSFTDREYGIAHGAVRIWPTDDKMFLVGASVFNLDDDGDVAYRGIASRSHKTYFGADVQLGWRIPWVGDHRILVRGGLLEGMPGGAVDWDPDHPFWEGQRLRFTLEGRQAYDSVSSYHLDEDAGPTMLRAAVSTPLWHRGDGFLGTVLGHLNLTVGASSLAQDPEFMVGIGLEYEDQDIKTLLGLVSTGR